MINACEWKAKRGGWKGPSQPGELLPLHGQGDMFKNPRLTEILSSLELRQD